MKYILKYLLILSIFSFVQAQGVGNITGIGIDGSKLILKSTSDIIIIKAVSENAVMINYLPGGKKDPNTLVIGDTNWTFTNVVIDTSGDPIKYSTNYFLIDIQRNPLRFSGYDVNGKLAFSEPLSGGFSSTGISLNTYAHNYYGIYNRDVGDLTSNSGGTIAAGSQGSAGAPFFWTPEGWGFLADADGGSISISSNTINYQQGNITDKADIELYFLFGTPKEIFKEMNEVSGKPPLPPKFSLGFMNTEWGIDETELRSDVQTYRSKGIPLDAYILDFDWMAWGEDNYGEFRWGNKFPSGPGGKLKADMDSLGVKLMGIRKPRIHTATVEGIYCDANGFFVDKTTDYFSGKQVGRLNFQIPAVRDWYWDSFVNQGNSYEAGIIGYWNDEADEYGGNFMFMQMQRSEYEGQRKYNNKRVWSINRNFYLGAQRYAYGMWSGDIQTGFQSMANQKLFMLTSINLGAPWWGMDIGGFNGTPSPENYYRWIQFGAFVPIFRVHGTLNEEREPWYFGAEAESIASKYIKLRYELLPYIYSAADQTHENGTPIVRPLIFEYPNDINSTRIYNEWMFGDAILVNPIVSPGQSTVQIYFPEGGWIDFNTGKEFYGPASMGFPVTKEDIPVFIKSGSIIPTSKAGEYSDDPKTSDLIIFKCYGEGNQSALLYEDDGNTYNYESGNFAKTTFVHSRNSEKAVLSIEAQTGSFVTPKRDYMTEFCFIDNPDSVNLDGKTILSVDSDSLRNSSLTGWSYDRKVKSTLVRFPDDHSAHQITLFLAEDNTPPIVDTVIVLSDTTIKIQFSEPVVLGNNEHSAENINNYNINNDISILSIEPNLSRDEVILLTSKHETNTKYTLTISNISDQSSHGNILKTTMFSYSIFETHTIILQEGLNGYSGSIDSHIAEYSPDNNMGSNDRFEACRFDGTNVSDDKEVLIKFDLSSVNYNDSNLVKAELILTLAETRNGAVEKKLGSYRILKPWNEGSGTGIDGRSAISGEVTWNSAQNGQLNWINKGGDYNPVPSVITTINDNINGEYKWDITQFFQFWRTTPDSNFGILLKEPEPLNASGTKVFYSKEYTGVNLRPKILLTYNALVTSTREIIASDNGLPEKYSLSQNYPNPFNPSTKIKYFISNPGKVKIYIYNLLGQRITTLVDKFQNAGAYEIYFNGSSLAAGIYYYQLKADNFIETKKMVLLK